MKKALLAIVMLGILSSVCYTQSIHMKQPLRFLALGDSYTIGESVVPELNWPAQFAAELEKAGYAVEDVLILAKTGWRADQLIEALTVRNPKNYNLVSLLIGVNNQYQGRPIEEMKRDFDCLLSEAIAIAGNDKKAVFIVSIPDYAYTPFGQTRNAESISCELDQYNCWQKLRASQEGIAYVDITCISRLGLEKPELVASDGLHPSGEQYRLWVELIMDQLIR